MENVDYKFTWDSRALQGNLAEQVVGSWEDGMALVVNSQILFQVNNCSVPRYYRILS